MTQHLNGAMPGLALLQSLWIERPTRTAKMQFNGPKYITLVRYPDGRIAIGSEYRIDKKTGAQSGDGDPVVITDAMLADHLLGATTYSVPLIGADGLALALVLELDKGAETGAQQLLAVAEAAGLIAFSIVCPGSDGHNGSHTWALYEQAWNPERLQEQSRQLLRAAGLPEKEVYPSQANIRLPFGLHVRSRHRGVMLLQGGQRFDLDTYEGLVDAITAVCELSRNTLVPPPAPEAQKIQSYVQMASAIGDVTPLDDYDKRTTRDEVEQLLVEAGWIEARQRGSFGYWTRPGKAPHDGHSATMGFVADTWLSVFSEGDSNLPGQSGRGTHYGPAKLYTHLKHKGDFRAAATALRAMGYGTSGRAVTRSPLAQQSRFATPAIAPQLDRSFLFDCLDKDEAGDAQLVEALYRGWMVYDYAAGAWYTFGPHAWVRYSGTPRLAVWSHVAAAYLNLAAQVQGNIDQEPDVSKKATMLTWVDALTARARKLRAANRINNVLTLSQELLGISGNEWDTDPWLLSVPNGVLDLRTGQLRDGQPDDYIRLMTPTEWQGLDTPAPRWERFVSEIMSDETDRIAFLQRLLGYALNGSTKEHILGVFVGERGRNGKRVLFETMDYVMGDYAQSVSTDVLIGQNHRRTAGSAQPHLMELQGKRLAYCSETGAHDALSTSQVKNITGGDPITARWLNENPITFIPTHTLFLQTNRKPQAPADDDALWERVKVIEFRVRFVDEPQTPDERPRDLELEDTLRDEAPGILAWLVRGGLEWLREGLQTPASVCLARDTYRKEESIDPFIEDCCIEWDGGSAEGGALYESYKAWCELRNLRAKSTVWLGKHLVLRYEKARLTSGPNAGRTVYHGITLRPRDEWPQHESPITCTALQDHINPSVPIEMPNTNKLYSNPEGLESILYSSHSNSSREEHLIQNPSIPSIPSGKGSEEELSSTQHVPDADWGSDDDRARTVLEVAAAGRFEMARWMAGDIVNEAVRESVLCKISWHAAQQTSEPAPTASDPAFRVGRPLHQPNVNQTLRSQNVSVEEDAMFFGGTDAMNDE